MNSRSFFSAVLLGAIGLIAATGCSKNKVMNPKANERPTIELTRAPYNESTRFEYSYRMNWLGYDPDGRVAYYRYAIDPPAATPQDPEPDTLWTDTDKSERLINFSATEIDDSKPGVHGASDFHTFVVKAIDNGGLGGPLQSAPLVRSFFTYTVAPTVQILNPVPTDRSRNYVTPSVRINWTGSDDDGILDNKKPVKYKYILLTQNSAVPFQVALQFPDSVRKYYAPRNWAGWDSTTADTTEKQFTNLVVGQDYMFVVVAFDEAGAYSPVFDQNSNMLNMRVTFAAQGGPLITIFNDFFTYHYDQGVYTTIDKYVIKIEVPAGEIIPFNWFADIPASSGANLRGFRWSLDIDNLDDQTPRTNERTDWKHWSQESGDATFAEVGPFGGGETHFFYVEAVDNNNLKSLAVVRFNVVQSDLTKDLLVVDDTRLKVDGKAAGAVCTTTPRALNRWPSAAELDTFLFAKGGFPWRCYPAGTITRPGLLNGYTFDTTGTRTGTAEVRVPLAKLGHYKHVIWITDQTFGANNNANGTDLTNSISAIRYMTHPGRANSVAAYLRQGGQVWMVGGGVGMAATMEYNSRKNDSGTYGPGFSSNRLETQPDAPELQPGRFMYDVTHWQSQFRATAAVLPTMTRFFGRFESTPNVIPPQYRNFPTALHLRSLALGDTVPPEKNSGDYYISLTDVEYLSQRNDILEDVDPSPLGIDEESTLDTLYYIRGSSVLPQNQNLYNVCMTVYKGPAYQYPIIFTGFNIWSWTKSECQAIVDAVLHDNWGYTKSVPQMRPAAVVRGTGSPSAATPLQSAAAMPVLRLGRLPDR